MLTRRQLLQMCAGILALPAGTLFGKDNPSTPLPLIKRPIPGTGELLPVIGMGTSRTFDTGSDTDSHCCHSGFFRR